jgi:hypothetical protein
MVQKSLPYLNVKKIDNACDSGIIMIEARGYSRREKYHTRSIGLSHEIWQILQVTLYHLWTVGWALSQNEISCKDVEK